VTLFKLSFGGEAAVNDNLHRRLISLFNDSFSHFASIRMLGKWDTVSGILSGML